MNFFEHDISMIHWSTKLSSLETYYFYNYSLRHLWYSTILLREHSKYSLLALWSILTLFLWKVPSLSYQERFSRKYWMIYRGQAFSPPYDLFPQTMRKRDIMIVIIMVILRIWDRILFTSKRNEAKEIRFACILLVQLKYLLQFFRF